MADQADTFIDKEFGRMETNEMEGKFGVMWRDKMKGEHMSHNTWEVVFGKGNLNGNKTAMENMQGDTHTHYVLYRITSSYMYEKEFDIIESNTHDALCMTHTCIS